MPIEGGITTYALTKDSQRSVSEQLELLAQQKSDLSYSADPDGNSIVQDSDRYSGQIRTNPPFGIEDGVTIEVTLLFNRLSEKSKLISYLSFIMDIYGAIEPEYVFGCTETDLEAVSSDTVSRHPPIDADTFAEGRITRPEWLMIFPPAMVETYGRDWLLNLPADRTESLNDGGILVVATEDIAEYDRRFELVTHISESLEPLEDAFEARHAEL